ncbi:hypothetical protein GLOTRDRAFT_140521 [Gloeophyllum trabeum ATCC 11539]|uniref:Uncharacterized protein n=1 Tax=Gloeophyllum trabeum (strain ATCC 11539 / FP-39264 / Madison 617) TaxID=670483 RepID=S7RHK0_GLOTA|nr:uncharacterized protein GLOTRDRAFT_140521 [Gloeophyllum trabeum ATCC 11539]EPQ52069.1 hypothetical protein GLOTRDRAFT_140521 [Gloeophyllum trabeum ATCC 11539]
MAAELTVRTTDTQAKCKTIEGTADILLALIERETEKAVCQARKDCEELEQRFAAFRTASANDLRVVSQQVSVLQETVREMQGKLEASSLEAGEARAEARNIKEAYDRLRGIILGAECVREMKEQTSSEVSGACSGDAVILVSTILENFSKTKVAWRAAEMRCAELEQTSQRAEQAEKKLARLEQARKKLQETLSRSSAIHEIIQEKELAVQKDELDTEFDVITAIPALLDRFQRNKEAVASLRTRLAEAESHKDATKNTLEGRITELKRMNAALRRELQSSKAMSLKAAEGAKEPERVKPPTAKKPVINDDNMDLSSPSLPKARPSKRPPGSAEVSSRPKLKRARTTDGSVIVKAHKNSSKCSLSSDEESDEKLASNYIHYPADNSTETLKSKARGQDEGLHLSTKPLSKPCSPELPADRPSEPWNTRPVLKGLSFRKSKDPRVSPQIGMGKQGQK